MLFLSCAVSLAARELSYKLVVVGGGAGGCGTANKFANKLGKDQVISDTAVVVVVMVTILSLLLFKSIANKCSNDQVTGSFIS